MFCYPKLVVWPPLVEPEIPDRNNFLSRINQKYFNFRDISSMYRILYMSNKTVNSTNLPIFFLCEKQESKVICMLSHCRAKYRLYIYIYISYYDGIRLYHYACLMQIDLFVYE